MRIGILETGKPPRSLQPHFGSYESMFRRLLGDAHPIDSFDVAHGHLPATPSACDAYVITGSPAGVSDPLPWIGVLKTFLQSAKRQAKLVGVCFGHQIMAEAFGGAVEKSPKGWGIGLHNYAIAEHAWWMDAVPAVAVPVSHQDQVVALPPAARVLAGNGFTPYGILAYADQPAISFQCHPEFAPDYASALIELMRGSAANSEMLDAAAETLAKPNDRARVARWIQRFITADAR